MTTTTPDAPPAPAPLETTDPLDESILDDEPQCQATQPDRLGLAPHVCLHTATHVRVATCGQEPVLWCSNRVLKHEATKHLLRCNHCYRNLEDCIVVRTL